MNKITLIGNLCNEPVLRTTQSGIAVCSFTLAVNRRKSSAEAGQREADFFRVTAWRQLGELCAKYLAKGRKVGVVGSVQVNTYTASDGTTRANMEVTADEVEFLSPANQSAQESTQEARDEQAGFVRVDDDLPF